MSFWQRIFGRKSSDDDGWNDHSKCLYLVAPDNQFLQFYNLDIQESELAQQLIEDISYDIGVRHIGTGNHPEKLET